MCCIFRVIILAIFMMIYNFHGFAGESTETKGERKDHSDISIIDALLHITCETEGVGNLLREQFSHTCIPLPVADFLLFSIISPTSAPAILRVKINDKDLFPDACLGKNKADPIKPTISFGYCKNILLTTNVVANFAKSMAEIIAGTMRGGKYDWGRIAKDWNDSFNKRNYHEMHENAKEGDYGAIGDVGIPPVFLWKVGVSGDQICVYATLGLFPARIGCKFIKEPFPKSKYSNFIDTPEEKKLEEPILKTSSEKYDRSNYLGDQNPPPDPTSLTKCMSGGKASESCYRAANDHSRTAIPMTGPMVECIKVMIAKIMISKDVCSFEQIYDKMSVNSRKSSVLFQFQLGMQKFVKILLTLYVMFYGMKIALGNKVLSKKEVMEFIFKLIFVTYFSIGLPVNTSSSGEVRMDGIVEYVLPLLFSLMSELASWVIDIAPSGLCKFNINEYEKAYKYLFIWDVLDCKMSHYLGLDALVFVKKLAVDGSSQGLDGNHIPPYLVFVILGLLTGYIPLISLALSYPLLLISVTATVVNLTICCIIMISVLALLAPLFVPLYLFNYTKSYAVKWANLLFSFSLQPLVAVLFLTVLFTLYDQAFYGSCKYINTKEKIGGKEVDVFLVNQKWSTYGKDEAGKCVASLGYIINHPLEVLKMMTGSIANYPGLTVDVGEISVSLLTAFLLLYLMQHFSSQLTGFVADITASIKGDNIAVSPNIKKRTKPKKDKKKDEAEDKASGGGKESEDKSSGKKGENGESKGGRPEGEKKPESSDDKKGDAADSKAESSDGKADDSGSKSGDSDSKADDSGSKSESSDNGQKDGN